MSRAFFRFYAELNDFLPRARRGVTFVVDFELPVTVKHMIESLGVPHTEVDLIVVNSESVGFARLLEDGDTVSVYPVFESIDITPALRLRPAPLRELRFVLDTHLGRLAAYLRMCGFDTLYGKGWDDRRLAAVASDEQRVLLTRDTGLLKRNQVTRGYFVRRTNPREQLREVLERFDLPGALRPFERCLRCNTLLEEVPHAEVIHRVPPRTRKFAGEYHICRPCDRVYWKGSHWRRMRRLLDQVRS